MSQTTTPAAAAFSSGAFSDAEKADVRRFCWYETYGGQGNIGFEGWRFFQEYGLLEYRMNNLAPAEYQNCRYFLSVLYPIEQALYAMYGTINVDTAASFVRNKDELPDRMAQFTAVRKQLCVAVGVPPGDQYEDENTVRIKA